MRPFDRDLIRGGHYGQRSREPRSKIRTHGRTDQSCTREENPCQLGAVHTWPYASVRAVQRYVRHVLGRMRGGRCFRTLVDMPLCGGHKHCVASQHGGSRTLGAPGQLPHRIQSQVWSNAYGAAGNGSVTPSENTRPRPPASSPAHWAYTPGWQHADYAGGGPLVAEKSVATGPADSNQLAAFAGINTSVLRPPPNVLIVGKFGANPMP
jgi:hypothetical protein